MHKTHNLRFLLEITYSDLFNIWILICSDKTHNNRVNFLKISFKIKLIIINKKNPEGHILIYVENVCWLSLVGH